MVTGRCISLFLNVIFWCGPGRERSKELWVYLKSTSEWGAKVITYGWTQQKIKHLFINLWSKPQQALKNDKLWSECEHARQNGRSCDMLTWNLRCVGLLWQCHSSKLLPSWGDERRHLQFMRQSLHLSFLGKSTIQTTHAKRRPWEECSFTNWWFLWCWSTCCKIGLGRSQGLFGRSCSFQEG